MTKCESCNYESKSLEQCVSCGTNVCNDCRFDDGCDACEGG